ncbi:MAG: hypothetical protein ACOYI2_03995 [Bacillota bacterium]|jgi:hypothetical protein
MIIDIQIDPNHFFNYNNTRIRNHYLKCRPKENRHKIIDPLIDPNIFIDITSR